MWYLGNHDSSNTNPTDWGNDLETTVGSNGAIIVAKIEHQFK